MSGNSHLAVETSFDAGLEMVDQRTTNLDQNGLINRIVSAKNSYTIEGTNIARLLFFESTPVEFVEGKTMRRILFGLLLIAGMAVSLSGSGASATQPDWCYGLTPTQSLNAPGTLVGTNGNDILFGSSGADVIKGKGGDDIICGYGGADQIDGGTGDDQIQAKDGSVALGGAHEDDIWVDGAGTVGDGGSGNDEVRATNGATAKGNSGADNITLWNAGSAFGGSGKDTIFSEAGTPPVNCGSGVDSYSLNGVLADGPAPISCEKVSDNF